MVEPKTEAAFYPRQNIGLQRPPRAGKLRSDTERLNFSDWQILFSIVAFFLEGSIRKWVLSPNDPFMYVCVFSKEAFLFAAILGSKVRLVGPPAQYMAYVRSVPLAICLLACLMAAAMDFNPVGAVMTIRSLIVLPLGACMVSGLITPRLQRPALVLFGVLILINLPLVIVQYFSPYDAPINCYVGGDSTVVATTGFSERVRATGTFSYISGVGVAALIGVASGLYMLSVEKTFQWKIFSVVIVIASYLIGLATVARGVVLGCSALIVAWTLLGKKLSTIVLVSIAIAGTYLAIIALGFDQLNEFLTGIYSRSNTTGDSILGRIAQPFTDLPTVMAEYPFGNGLGIGQTAARRTGAIAVVESEWARVVYEIGVLGFVGYVMTYGGAILFLMRWSRRTRSQLMKLLLSCCVCICTILLYGGVAFNHVSSLAFWGIFVAGTYFSQSIPQPGRTIRGYN